MIASFSHKFIFVKTRKTGGTSIEIVLSSWCTDGDICTTLMGPDEITRYKAGGAARNFLNDRSIDEEYARVVLKGNPKTIQAFRKKHKTDRRFFNHMSAESVRRELPELWERAFKFTVERHPYDRVISAAWWNARKKNLAPDQISAEIDLAIEAPTFPNYPLYTDGRGVVVDHVMRFESLSSELIQLGKRFGRDVPFNLPKAKSQFRKDRRPATDVLSDRQMRRIQEIVGVEFDIMNYER